MVWRWLRTGWLSLGGDQSSPVAHIDTKTPPLNPATPLSTQIELKQNLLKNTAIPKKTSTPRIDIHETLRHRLFLWLYGRTEPLSEIIPPSKARFLKRLESSMQDLKKGDQNLPRRPNSLPLLIKLLNDSQCSREQISSAILADPALTNQILRTANSPYFRVSGGPIESIDKAIFIMGSEGIRQLISATLMKPMMKGHNKPEQQFSEKVWQWGLCNATATEEIYRISALQRSSYFLLGLLPALSQLIIYRMASEISLSLEINEEESAILVQQAIARNQWRICHLLANAWGLPPSYCKELLEAETAPPHKLSSLLQDAMSISIDELLQTTGESTMELPEVDDALSISKEDIIKIRARIRRQLKEHDK